MTDKPPWLKIALDLIGTYEWEGEEDNPVILKWAKDCGFKEYKHDSIPWCALFVNYALHMAGYRGTGTLWALDFAKYGTKLMGPAVGAIVSKRRQGGGHVAIVVGVSAFKHLICVGGNVNDQVMRQVIPVREVVSYNWPPGYPLPDKVGLNTLPLTSAAARADSEE